MARAAAVRALQISPCTFTWPSGSRRVTAKPCAPTTSSGLRLSAPLPLWNVKTDQASQAAIINATAHTGILTPRRGSSQKPAAAMAISSARVVSML